MVHELPELEYDYDALEKHIDEKTMKIHHTKHHQGYVNKLNNALEGHEDLQEMDVEDLLRNINDVPEGIKQAVINNGGGHANHSLFWTIMSPEGGGDPVGDIAEAIEESFGSLQNFKEDFSAAASGRFGSGWAWLVVDDGDLKITSTKNQDSPLMEGQTPILGLDVWEHAYYVQYNHKRGSYINAWWNVVNWEEVERRYNEAE